MLDHKHLIINATARKPPTDPQATVDFLRDLVEKIGMKIKIGPFADYCEADGNNGITGAVCIETSHISIHAWDKADPPYLRLDVYSCATFDTDTVLKFMQIFEPTEMDYVLLDRNEKIKVQESSSVSLHAA
jgi:S-adenosylmethionine/arginine decarboxylase-like enzyme